MVEIACLLSLVGVVVSYLKMRQAWQWWSTRQSIRLHEEAETIRDRLLQESFTMRRSLEMSLIDQPNPAIQHCLEQLNDFHQTLNALSDRLSPPYAQDDLSLAIAHKLKAWESQHPNLTTHFTLPSVWNQPIHHTDALILDALDELLRIRVSNLLTPSVIFVSLSHNALDNELNLEAQIPDAEHLDLSLDLKYLAQTLHFLAGGHCFYHVQQQTLTWHYRQQRSFIKSTCKD